MEGPYAPISPLPSQELQVPPAKRMLSSDGGVEHATTPQWLLEYICSEFPCDFDPCALQENAAFDGLRDHWQGFSFVNPPYSETQAWVEKAAREAEDGNFSVLLIPAVFNSLYWRETVYSHASEIRIFTCPIKFTGYKKQIVQQMALVVFAGPSDGENGDLQHPPVTLIQPPNWEDHYYKRRRNQTRFATTASKR